MATRFLDNEDKTISDSLTGLMWQESYAYVETGNNISWYGAQGYIEKLNNQKIELAKIFIFIYNKLF